MSAAIKKSWYQHIPHAVVLLFSIIVLVTLATHLIPSGEYSRVLVDGRNRVVPNSYQLINPQPVGFFEMFTLIPDGFAKAIKIIFIVLAGGIMFSIMDKTKAIENAVGTLVKSLGTHNKNLLVIILTLVFGFLGVAVGYENNIAMVPIAAVVSLAIGGDLILAAGISVGAMTVGFGLSPINPYTVGTGHKIAELGMFSGWELRSVLCFMALSIMAYYNVRYLNKINKEPNKSIGAGLDESGIALSQPLESYKMDMRSWLVIGIFCIGLIFILIGVFQWKWYLDEISAIFIIIAICCGVAGRMSSETFSQTLLDGVAKAAPGAFMVGLATTIQVIMERGMIADTISYQLSEILKGLPLYASAISMTISQSVINLLIPSGSGQALATLPVMIPLGEVLGLTRQTTILAFQIGDGVTNLVNPSLGGLIAMLAICRVPLDRWLRFIFPLVISIIIISWITLMLAVATGYS